MNKDYAIKKYKCSICGKTVKKICNLEADGADYYPTDVFYKMPSTGDLICKECESQYRLLNNYSYRGYGYKYDTYPRKTRLDKNDTPTFGVELEVAGNIKNIDKIKKITSGYYECSIGYDTSVEGAQFELSYSPGTYYWYLYESNLRNVCKLLQKDEWTKNSETIGTHIHLGNINPKKFYAKLILAETLDINFWDMMRAIGRRDFNQYCEPDFGEGHHSAISYSRKWRTVEFRFFAGTYDADTIFMRMKFIRQIFNNITDEGLDWSKFDKKVKDWMKQQIELSYEDGLLPDKLAIRLTDLINGNVETEPYQDECYINEQKNLYDVYSKEDGLYYYEEDEEEDY
jgi:hypothetical protein